MAAFVFTVGTLDLSSYLDVQESDGLDPFGDPLAPQFGESPLADYQPLIGVTASNREGVWPLYLKAATKDALHALVVAIRAELDKPRPLTVEWRDSGASQSTFFEIEYGKLIPKTRYWLQTHDYLQATLHLFVRPYGHTGTYRSVGTYLGSSALAAVPIGALSGDAPALLSVSVGGASAAHQASVISAPGYSPPPDVVIVSAIPTGYQWFIGPSQLAAGDSTASVTTATGAIGSLIAYKPTSDTVPDNTGRIDASATGSLTQDQVRAAWKGNNRVLAIARVASSAGYETGAHVTMGGALSPTSLLGPTQAVDAQFGRRWNVIDMGVFTVGASAWDSPLRLRARRASGVGMEYAGLFILPEETTTIVVENVGETYAGGTYAITYNFDTALRQTLRTTSAASLVPVEYVDIARRGAIPAASAAHSHIVAGVIRQTLPGLGDGLERSLAVDVRVREQFSYAR